MTRICVCKLTSIGSDNDLSPGRHQAIIWTNTGISLIGTLGTNFSEILIEIYTFSFNKMHMKISSAKFRPFCLDLNVSWFFSPQATGARLASTVQSLCGVILGLAIGFYYSWKLALFILAFAPFILISGFIQVKIMMGSALKDKKALEEAGKVRLFHSLPPQPK